MSILHCRGSITLAAALVALGWSARADAQVVAPGSPGQFGSFANNLVSGVQYDLLNQVKAERRLEQLQVKVRRDTERGHSAAVNRDVRRIEYTRYRIAVDRWLIRQNSLQDPGYYPVRTDPESCAAIAQVASPAFATGPSQAAPTP